MSNPTCVSLIVQAFFSDTIINIINSMHLAFVFLEPLSDTHCNNQVKFEHSCPAMEVSPIVGCLLKITLNDYPVKRGLLRVIFSSSNLLGKQSRPTLANMFDIYDLTPFCVRVQDRVGPSHRLHDLSLSWQSLPGIWFRGGDAYCRVDMVMCGVCCVNHLKHKAHSQ